MDFPNRPNTFDVSKYEVRESDSIVAVFVRLSSECLLGCLVAHPQNIICFRNNCVPIDAPNDQNQPPSRLFSLEITDGQEFKIMGCWCQKGEMRKAKLNKKQSESS